MKKVLIIGGILLIDYLIAQNNKPKIIVKKTLPNNYNAQTIPPFGIFVNEQNKENENLIKHELIHWQQYQKKGIILFYASYFLNNILNGYDKNPMEIEARKKVGENEHCQLNYTNCVRNGKSITVFNPNFRK